MKKNIYRVGDQRYWITRRSPVLFTILASNFPRSLARISKKIILNQYCLMVWRAEIQFDECTLFSTCHTTKESSTLYCRSITLIIHYERYHTCTSCWFHHHLLSSKISFLFEQASRPQVINWVMPDCMF